MEHLSKFIEEVKELFWELGLDEFRWPHGQWVELIAFLEALESTILTFAEKNVKGKYGNSKSKKQRATDPYRR